MCASSKILEGTDDMADHILMIDGNEDIVSEFNARLLELGMIPIEMDTANNSGEKVYSDVNLGEKPNSFGEEDFLGKKDDSQYTFEPITMVSLAVTLLGSAGFASIVTSVLNAHKGEGDIEIDEKGNITKITFKDMNPRKVPKMIEEISEAARKAGSLNKRAILKDALSQDNAFTEDTED